MLTYFSSLLCASLIVIVIFLSTLSFSAAPFRLVFKLFFLLPLFHHILYQSLHLIVLLSLIFLFLLCKLQLLSILLSASLSCVSTSLICIAASNRLVVLGQNKIVCTFISTSVSLPVYMNLDFVISNHYFPL